MLKLINFFYFTLFFSNLALAQHHHDKPSVHGMFLFGKSKTYLSHLPMFHAPHNYQVLLEVELPSSAKEKYLGSGENDPKESIYTIIPEVFSLTRLAEELKSFKAQIFKGHFERGGVPITEQVLMKVTKVLLFKKLDPMAAVPELAHYHLIGNQFEQFIIHTISAKPDFDHIAQVSVNNIQNQLPLIENQALALKLQVSNLSPLEEATQYSGQPHNSPAINLEVTKILYTEFGDLSF
jgi:hypothetical protein